MTGIFYLVLALAGFGALAMPVKSELIKPHAYYQEVDGGLLEPLDLKVKSIGFTAADMDRCGLALVREASTLNYSCTLTLPGGARLSKLRRQLSASTVDVEFGGTKRKVFIKPSPDARSITLVTGFDSTGVDYEVSKFNDDFFAVFNKVALLVIGEAVKKPVRIEVLESRDLPQSAPRPALVTK